MPDLLQIHPGDSVAVAVRALQQGETVTIGDTKIVLRNTIPAGHKAAVRELHSGDPVIKYGCPIGEAIMPIAVGAHVHSHNMKSLLSGTQKYEYCPQLRELPRQEAQTFQGFVREDGRVGIRNEVWIIPTVGCVNAIAKAIEEEVRGQRLPDSVDGVFSYSHPYGCSQLGGDQLYTQKALCGLIRHPNAGGVLVLGLGCENNNIEELRRVLGPVDENRVKFLNCQDCTDEIVEGVQLTEELCRYAGQFHREPCGTEHLVVGLKCGGSDGFSGITANPLVGAFSDCLLAQGGTAVMTEVPEMFGAEQLLMNRCRTRNVFDRTVGLVNGFKDYFLRYGERVDENPSPGNKAGGITTLEDKSLGCVQKAGFSPVEAVLDYGDPVTHTGLNLLQGPGNDLVASCALAASGAQLILFTTGRGTPFGCPVPTLKISSNTALARQKRHWIDFDAGQLLDGKSKDVLTEELFTLVLEIASGERHAHAEALDKRDFSIFKDGVTL